MIFYMWTWILKNMEKCVGEFRDADKYLNNTICFTALPNKFGFIYEFRETPWIRLGCTWKRCTFLIVFSLNNFSQVHQSSFNFLHFVRKWIWTFERVSIYVVAAVHRKEYQQSYNDC